MLGCTLLYYGYMSQYKLFLIIPSCHELPGVRPLVAGACLSPVFLSLLLVETVAPMQPPQLWTVILLTGTQACTSRLVVCLCDTPCASDLSASTASLAAQGRPEQPCFRMTGHSVCSACPSSLAFCTPTDLSPRPQLSSVTLAQVSQALPRQEVGGGRVYQSTGL